MLYSVFFLRLLFANGSEVILLLYGIFSMEQAFNALMERITPVGSLQEILTLVSAFLSAYLYHWTIFSNHASEH
jgi:hypothetical protein